MLMKVSQFDTLFNEEARGASNVWEAKELSKLCKKMMFLKISGKLAAQEDKQIILRFVKDKMLEPASSVYKELLLRVEQQKQ